MADSAGMSMTEAELRQFFVLLQRFCDTELDQFEHLIIPSRLGEVYVELTRELNLENLRERYRRLLRHLVAGRHLEGQPCPAERFRSNCPLIG
ncbi:hypothetical protein [Nocardia sp. NPDC050175]|uniref:hypothetical protein n=1 Tax=Nocardia sp. NPDC050175 TaxID=3364317 RepID=UPI0037A5B292